MTNLQNIDEVYVPPAKRKQLEDAEKSIAFYYITGNPPHKGHMDVILSTLEFAKTIYVVINNIKTKQKNPIPSRAHRIEMAKICINNTFNECKIFDNIDTSIKGVHILKHGTSSDSRIETINGIWKNYVNVYVVVGADKGVTLPKYISTLREQGCLNVQLLVMPRLGYNTVRERDFIVVCKKHKDERIISSTAVRNKQQNTFDHVNLYIDSHNLYNVNSLQVQLNY